MQVNENYYLISDDTVIFADDRRSSVKSSNWKPRRTMLLIRWLAQASDSAQSGEVQINCHASTRG
jgi:hypothetical protein